MKNQPRKKTASKRSGRLPTLAGIETTAYRGDKYLTDELLPLLIAAETAILEGYVLTGRKLTDRHVRDAMVKQILHLKRADTPRGLTEPFVGEREFFDLGDFLIWNVRQRWDAHFETAPLVNRRRRAGVLRTILGSIDTWRDATGQGYLRFLESYLVQLGVHVETIREEATSARPKWPHWTRGLFEREDMLPFENGLC